MAFADEIWSSGQAGGQKYTAFLEAGSSLPPTVLLREAGVGLGSPESILRALRAYDRLVDELEATLDAIPPPPE